MTNEKLSSKIPPFSSNNNFELWILLDHARFAISRARELELARVGLTPEQAMILHTLKILGGSATMSEISDITLRQHHSVSTLVNRMTKQGLLKKTKSPKDKKYQVVVTEKGNKVYGAITRQSIEMTFSALKSKEKQEFASSLQKLIDQTRDLLGVDYRPPFLEVK